MTNYLFTSRQNTSAKVHNTCRNLRSLELLIQASQEATSENKGSKKPFFLSFTTAWKSENLFYNLSSLPFLRFFTFFTLFGMNWNDKRLKKIVQDIF